MDVRMVNAVFEDRGRPDFDAEAGTDWFLARVGLGQEPMMITAVLSVLVLESEVREWLRGPRAAAAAQPAEELESRDYFPPPESQGGWRKLQKPDDIRRFSGMDPAKLDALRGWLLKSDDRPFAAVVIRRGYIVLEVERGNSAKTDSRQVASVSKAICATVLAIASEQSRQGSTPRKMTFDDRAFDFIPWAWSWRSGSRKRWDNAGETSALLYVGGIPSVGCIDLSFGQV